MTNICWSLSELSVHGLFVGVVSQTREQFPLLWVKSWEAPPAHIQTSLKKQEYRAAGEDEASASVNINLMLGDGLSALTSESRATWYEIMKENSTHSVPESVHIHTESKNVQNMIFLSYIRCLRRYPVLIFPFRLSNVMQHGGDLDKWGSLWLVRNRFFRKVLKSKVFTALCLLWSLIFCCLPLFVCVPGPADPLQPWAVHKLHRSC